MRVALDLAMRIRESLSSPAPVGPVQPCTHADERDARIKDGVTDEMQKALIAKPPRDAENLSTKMHTTPANASRAGTGDRVNDHQLETPANQLVLLRH